MIRDAIDSLKTNVKIILLVVTAATVGITNTWLLMRQNLLIERDEVVIMLLEQERAWQERFYEERLSCEILTATITNGEYSHTYCKGESR